MNYRHLLPIVLSTVLGLASAPALSAPITNADVVKLLQAGIPEEVILKAIGNGEPKFDTSADALVALKKHGASPAVLSAILGAGSGGSARPAAGSSPVAAHGKDAFNPEEVTVLVDGNASAMQYLVPTLRTAARGLGFGGVATYAALAGPSAARRLKSTGIEFIVSVPKNAQVAGYVTLASFATRKNDTREVMIGGGYMSYSTGITKDRVVAITTEQLPDQSRAKEGFVLYKVAPAAPLAKGEYALVLLTAEFKMAGFFGGGSANSFFDFGVD